MGETTTSIRHTRIDHKRYNVLVLRKTMLMGIYYDPAIDPSINKLTWRPKSSAEEGIRGACDGL